MARRFRTAQSIIERNKELNKVGISKLPVDVKEYELIDEYLEREPVFEDDYIEPIRYNNVTTYKLRDINTSEVIEISETMAHYLLEEEFGDD